MIDFCIFWSGLEPETKAAVIGAVSTIGVGAIGFGGLILQMRSQAKQSCEAVAENERRRLKAAMYDDAVATCRDLADTAIELSNALRMMMLQVQFAAHAHAQGQDFDLPAARYPVLLLMYSSFSDAALKFIFLVENRRIVNPRILIFRTAMSVVLHDTRNLMHSEFVSNIMTSIPTQMPDGTLFSYIPPSVEHAEVITRLSEEFIESLNDAVMYTEDFIVEMQNHLLGDLFKTKVSHRVPLNPQKRVITLNESDELEHWFRTSTNWGKEMARIEAETTARFS